MPPAQLAARVGTVEGVKPLEFYVQEGERLRGVIEDMLPGGWSWRGKRALDFGCGSARVLRHFAPEADTGKFWGCDIDEASIAWDRANLSPPFRFFVSAPEPPLPLSAGSLDLIWAMSVFTHITDGWSAWIAEMHRLLAPGGVLIASFLGEGIWDALVGEPYVESKVGMAVLRHWEGPDAWVFHSEWWLREHWGRALDVLSIRRPPRTADGAPQITHSYIALRKMDGEVSPEELEQISHDEVREIAGLQTTLRLARSDLVALATPQLRPSFLERAVARLRRILARP